MFREGGYERELSNEEIHRYWKGQMLASFREVEPLFLVDERNTRLLQALYRWVWCSTSSVLDPTKGLLLWGPVGVGKSVILKGLQIYESKINKACFGYTHPLLGFGFVSAAELSLLYTEKGIEGLAKYTNRFTMTNLAIDEVGREPVEAKYFGTELNVIQMVLQLRYESRRQVLTHLTTNLNPDRDFAAIYGSYIVDRLKELFNVIEIRGESRR